MSAAKQGAQSACSGGVDAFAATTPVRIMRPHALQGMRSCQRRVGNAEPA